MATFQRNPSGTWRAIVRRKGVSTSQSFQRKADAINWATEIEYNVLQGRPTLSSSRRVPTLAQLIDLHIRDMCEVGRTPGRSKSYCLEKLKERLGHLKPTDLNRTRLIGFAKQRYRDGAGPVTIGMDIGYIKTVLDHANGVHGMTLSTESITHARIGLNKLGLIGKSAERDRRPTSTELGCLTSYFDAKPRQKIPMSLLIRFAVCTAMRQDEICRIQWKDLDEIGRTIVVRERKDPRKKRSNDQTVPLVDFIGDDPIQIMLEELGGRDRIGRIFSYNARSVGAAFTRACRQLEIHNLHFHDLRHEAASRLFEAGLEIPHVARITGHRDWRQLARYTHLRPQRIIATEVRATVLSAPESRNPLRISDQKLRPSEQTSPNK